MKSSTIKKTLYFFCSIMLIFAFLIPQGSEIISAATTKKQTVKSNVLQQGKQFTLMNMPYNGTSSIISTYKDKDLTIRTIQNFDYTPDGKYIFTIGECSSDGTKHGLLTRCALPKKTGQNAEAEALYPTVLEGFGHSDVIAITQDNLKKKVYNIWVSCKPDSNGYGRQIARLTYKVSKSGEGKISKTVYIKGFEKTNVLKGKAGYYTDKVKPQRVHCAIDTDSNQIVFRLHLPSGYGCYYVSYNFENINTALNSLKNKASFSIASKPKWQKARILCNLVPLCTYQSFAVKDNSLYLAGGHFGLGAQLYVINYKTQKEGNIKETNIKNTSQLSEIINIGAVIKINDADYDKNYLEIQGLKVTKESKKTYCHINFNCSGPSMRNSVSIYKFEKK